MGTRAACASAREPRSTLSGVAATHRRARYRRRIDSRKRRIGAFPSAVVEALCDDLNTPVALAALHEIANAIHRDYDARTAHVTRSAARRRLAARFARSDPAATSGPARRSTRRQSRQLDRRNARLRAIAKTSHARMRFAKSSKHTASSSRTASAEPDGRCDRRARSIDVLVSGRNPCASVSSLSQRFLSRARQLHRRSRRRPIRRRSGPRRTATSSAMSTNTVPRRGWVSRMPHRRSAICAGARPDRRPHGQANARPSNSARLARSTARRSAAAPPSRWVSRWAAKTAST